MIHLEFRNGSFLDREKLTICWSVLGEKRVISPGIGRGTHGPHHPALRMSGAYVVSEGHPSGFVKYLFHDPDRDEESPKVIHTARSVV